MYVIMDERPNLCRLPKVIDCLNWVAACTVFAVAEICVGIMGEMKGIWSEIYCVKYESQLKFLKKVGDLFPLSLVSWVLNFSMIFGCMEQNYNWKCMKGTAREVPQKFQVGRINNLPSIRARIGKTSGHWSR